MKKYLTPCIAVKAYTECRLMCAQSGPGATDVRDPDGSNIEYDDYSVWDEVNYKD